MESDKKVQEALQLLKEASKEKRVELSQMLADLCCKTKETKEAARDAIKNTVVGIDKSAHDKPWNYIFGAAIGGLFLGLFLKSRR